jgi:hypothetical protein
MVTPRARGSIDIAGGVLDKLNPVRGWIARLFKRLPGKPLTEDEKKAEARLQESLSLLAERYVGLVQDFLLEQFGLSPELAFDFPPVDITGPEWSLGSVNGTSIRILDQERRGYGPVEPLVAAPSFLVVYVRRERFGDFYTQATRTINVRDFNITSVTAPAVIPTNGANATLQVTWSGLAFFPVSVSASCRSDSGYCGLLPARSYSEEQNPLPFELGCTCLGFRCEAARYTLTFSIQDASGLRTEERDVSFSCAAWP